LPIYAQVLQQLDKHINIGASFYPNDALGSNINTTLLNQDMDQVFALFLD
jgi:hypothetical protein